MVSANTRTPSHNASARTSKAVVPGHISLVMLKSVPPQHSSTAASGAYPLIVWYLLNCSAAIASAICTMGTVIFVLGFFGGLVP